MRRRRRTVRGDGIGEGVPRVGVVGSLEWRRRRADRHRRHAVALDHLHERSARLPTRAQVDGRRVLLARHARNEPGPLQRVARDERRDGEVVEEEVEQVGAARRASGTCLARPRRGSRQRRAGRPACSSARCVGFGRMARRLECRRETRPRALRALGARARRRSVGDEIAGGGRRRAPVPVAPSGRTTSMLLVRRTDPGARSGVRRRGLLRTDAGRARERPRCLRSRQRREVEAEHPGRVARRRWRAGRRRRRRRTGARRPPATRARCPRGAGSRCPT